MEKNQIKVLQSGASPNKKHSVFQKIANSKEMNSLLMGFFLFGLTSISVPDNANAGKIIHVPSTTEKIDIVDADRHFQLRKQQSLQKTNDIVYFSDEKNAIYNIDDNIEPEISEETKAAFGMPHPLTTKEAKAYITNKITDNGIERYIVKNDEIKNEEDRLVLEADAYNIEFRNPHTGSSDSMPVLIKKGQSDGEIKFLLNTISAGLETKTVYDNLKKSEEHSGKPIFSSSYDDSVGATASCNRPKGLIYLAEQPFFEALNGLGHETEHFNNNIIINSGIINKDGFLSMDNPMGSTQIDEADARVAGFNTEREYMSLYPDNHSDYSMWSEPLADVYKMYKDYNLSEKNMNLILFVAALHVDPYAGFYSNDPKQFSNIANNLKKAGQNPQQEENFLSGVNHEDIKNLSFGRRSVGENDIFSNPELKVRVVSDDGRQVDIYPNKIDVPQQSGILNLVDIKSQGGGKS